MPKLCIDTSLLLAASTCISNEETRYYLNGVFVKPHPEKGVILAATDGHILACMYDEWGSMDYIDHDVVLTTPWTDKSLKTTNRTSKRVWIDLETGVGDVRITPAAWPDGSMDACWPVIPPKQDDHPRDGLVSVEAIKEVTYPDYPRVVPEHVSRTCKHVAFNSALLTRITQGARHVSDAREPVLQIYQDDAHKGDGPLRVNVLNFDRGFFVLMPVRGKDEVETISKPYWFA